MQPEFCFAFAFLNCLNCLRKIAILLQTPLAHTQITTVFPEAVNSLVFTSQEEIQLVGGWKTDL